MRIFRSVVSFLFPLCAAAIFLAACASDNGTSEKTGNRPYYGNSGGSIMSVYR